MLDANSKSDIFLSSIKKYAVQQSDMLRNEAEQFKEKELQRIKNNAIEEANAMFARETAAIKAKIAGETAEKYESSRIELFEKRNRLTENVYKAATAKLIDFASSEKYSEYITKSANEVAEIINGRDVTVYLRAVDRKYESSISEILGGRVFYEYTDDIKIGGFRLHCPYLKIIIDETLDEKLNNTREWFTEHSNLRVL